MTQRTVEFRAALTRLSFFGLTFISSVCVQAQSALAPIHTELVGTWTLTLFGEPLARTVVIRGVTIGRPDAYVLDANLSTAAKVFDVMKGEMISSAAQKKLIFTDSSDTKFEASQDVSGAFIGTYTNSRGIAKACQLCINWRKASVGGCLSISRDGGIIRSTDPVTQRIVHKITVE